GGTLRFDVVGNSLKLYFTPPGINQTTTLLTSALNSDIPGAGLVGVRGSDGYWDNFSASQLQPNLPFSDDFQRANSGTPGVNYAVKTGTIVLDSNRLYGSPGTDLAVYSGDPAGYYGTAAADVSVASYVGLGLSSTATAQIIARYAGPGDLNYYAGAVSLSG